MIAIIMPFFILLCMLLVLAILLQPGKGDMGLGSYGAGGQQLFGGSGGQDFFEKVTWTMGILFMVGALALSIMRTGERSSRFARYRVEEQQAPLTQAPGDLPLD